MGRVGPISLQNMTQNLCLAFCASHRGGRIVVAFDAVRREALSQGAAVLAVAQAWGDNAQPIRPRGNAFRRGPRRGEPNLGQSKRQAGHPESGPNSDLDDTTLHLQHPDHLFCVCRRPPRMLPQGARTTTPKVGRWSGPARTQRYTPSATRGASAVARATTAGLSKSLWSKRRCAIRKLWRASYMCRNAQGA